MPILTRKYGYLKGKEDLRDELVVFTDHHVHAFCSLRNVKKNNSVFDLRNLVLLPQSISDMDQGNLGSCTANAISYAYVYDEIKQGNQEIFMPSRLFIYYNERMIEGTIGMDAGAEIRSGIKSINKYGVCIEKHWAYDTSKFAIKPPAKIYTEAKLARAVKYARIDLSKDINIMERVNHLKKSIQSGFPFVFGFIVYESFESFETRKSGMVSMPKKDERQCGGHAVCAIGFDDDKKCFIVKNSWGSSWGLNGYFYLPYNYIGDCTLADDFWIIQRVTDPDNLPGFRPEDINPASKEISVILCSESQPKLIIKTINETNNECDEPLQQQQQQQQQPPPNNESITSNYCIIL